MLTVNPNWRRAVKPKSNVAIIASQYVNWSGGSILPFQVRFLNEAFAQDRNGKWRYSRVALNTPRQNGKTKLLTALIIYAMYVMHASILVTAHEMSVAHKIYEDVFDTISHSEELNMELKADGGKFASGAGKEYIRLSTGGTVSFRSRRNPSAGMGGTYDIVIFDEAQELKADYEGMITKTLKTKPNALVVYTGTPFLPNSIGDTFNVLLDTADEQDSVYAVRYGIDDETADLTDRSLWALTNPLYPAVIDDSAFLNDLAVARQNGAAGLLDMRIQDLGLWWKDKIPPAIPAELWQASTLDIANDPNTNVIAITSDPMSGILAMSVASMTAETVDGTEHYPKWRYITGEIISERSSNESWKWIGEAVKGMPRHTAIILDAGALNKPLMEYIPGSMDVVQLNNQEFLASQQGFMDALNSGLFKHPNSPDLTDEVRNAQKRASGDLWKFDAIRQTHDDGRPATVTGLKGLAEAVWYRNVNKPQEKIRRTVYA